MISVNVDTQTGEPPPLPIPVIESIVTAILAEHRTEHAEMQVVFADDEYLRQLKRTFLGQDLYTDVIAFPLNDDGEPLEAEVYISLDRALDNSRENQEPYRRELLRLVIHGCLHLVGHSDETASQQSQMRALEEHFLRTVPAETLQ